MRKVSVLFVAIIFLALASIMHAQSPGEAKCHLKKGNWIEWFEGNSAYEDESAMISATFWYTPAWREYNRRGNLVVYAQLWYKDPFGNPVYHLKRLTDEQKKGRGHIIYWWYTEFEFVVKKAAQYRGPYQISVYRVESRLTSVLEKNDPLLGNPVAIITGSWDDRKCWSPSMPKLSRWVRKNHPEKHPHTFLLERIDEMRAEYDHLYDVAKLKELKFTAELLDFSREGDWSKGTFVQVFKYKLKTSPWHKPRNLTLVMCYLSPPSRNEFARATLTLPAGKTEIVVTTQVHQGQLKFRVDYRPDRTSPILLEEIVVKIEESAQGETWTSEICHLKIQGSSTIEIR